MFVMVDQQQTFDDIFLIFCIGARYLKCTGKAGNNSIRRDFIYPDISAEIPLYRLGKTYRF